MRPLVYPRCAPHPTACARTGPTEAGRRPGSLRPPRGRGRHGVHSGGERRDLLPSTILPLYFERATTASVGRVKDTMAIPREFFWELYTMMTLSTGPTVLEKSVCACVQGSGMKEGHCQPPSEVRT